MVGTIITYVVIAVIALIVINGFTGWKKEATKRNAWEKISASFITMWTKKSNEVADSVRTPEITREEGIQKCQTAIRELDNDYKEEVKCTLMRVEEMKDNLPALKDKPGYYEGKARKAKKSAEDAKNADKPEEVWKKYEENCYLYLEYRNRARNRVSKVESAIETYQTSLEVAEAVYEGRRATLDDLLEEFKSMTTAITKAKFTKSLSLINSLRQESVIKLREQRVNIEAENRVAGREDESSISVDRTSLEDDYKNL